MPSIVNKIAIENFRSIESLAFTPTPLCALVGVAQAGKSNVLEAIRAALDPSTKIRLRDAPRADNGETVIRVGTPTDSVEIAGSARSARRSGPAPPPLAYFPASARAGKLTARPIIETPATREAFAAFHSVFAEPSESETSAGANAEILIETVDACCAARAAGIVFLIEEPELFLSPQSQRFLYRALRTLTDNGNQVIYSTHSPAFLNVARLDELVYVQRDPRGRTSVTQPNALGAPDDFRVLSEFDAERAELFLSRATILVEGMTEKLALPFVFAAIGIDADRLGISIVECGGKWNIPLFGIACRAAGVPFLALFDRDAPPGKRQSSANRMIAETIASIAGPERSFELAPDFEATSGMRKRRGKKPEHAWREFSSRSAADMPDELIAAAKLAVELADSGRVNRSRAVPSHK